MLTVGARFPEKDGTCRVGDRFAETVDAFAVAFHVQLLEMSGETDKRLAVRQDGGGRKAVHSFEDAEKGVGKGGVVGDFGVEGRKVGFVCAGKEFVESFGSESERQDDGADRRCRRMSQGIRQTAPAVKLPR